MHLFSVGFGSQCWFWQDAWTWPRDPLLYLLPVQEELSLGNSLNYSGSFFSSPGRGVKLNPQLPCYKRTIHKKKLLHSLQLCITSPTLVHMQPTAFIPSRKRQGVTFQKYPLRILQSPILIEKGILRVGNMQHLSLSIKRHLFPYFH